MRQFEYWVQKLQKAWSTLRFLESCSPVVLRVSLYPAQSTDQQVLSPAEHLEYQDLPNAVVRLAKMFPQLHLGEMLEQL